VSQKNKKLTKIQVEALIRVLRGDWRSTLFTQAKVPQPTIDALKSRGLISAYRRSTNGVYTSLLDYCLTDEGLSTLKAEAPDRVTEKDLRAFEDLNGHIQRQLDEQQRQKEWLAKTESVANQIQAARGIHGVYGITSSDKISQIRKLGQWPPAGLAKMLREAHGMAVSISAADGTPAPPFVTDLIDQLWSPLPGKVAEAAIALRKLLTEDDA
jgi:hypothetical protein